MCFLKYVISYLWLKRKYKIYLKTKERSNFGLTKVTKHKVNTGVLKERFHFLVSICRKQKSRQWCKRLTTSGTFENFVVTAIVGLIVGIMITFAHFYTVLYRGQASFLWCFLLRMPLLVAITCSLAFSERGRCFLLLAPLQMFSSSGAHFMTGQLMLLEVTGPMANLRHNLDILQESGTCQQRGVMAAAADIADILFGPFSSFKQAAAQIIKGIRKMVERMERILAAFKRTVMTVASAIQDAARWINDKMTRCRSTVGTAHDHCIEAFTWMHDECRVSVPSMLAGVCSVTDVASNLCAAVKPGEYLCDLVSFTVDPLVTTINQRIRRLWDRAYTLFYFDVDIHHEYNIDENSRSIADELKKKVLGILDSSFYIWIADTIYSLINLFLELYFVWRMFQYYRVYQRREDFDNYFVNDRLQDIDMRETLKGGESVFPLKRVEKSKYVRVYSFSLTKKEMKTYTYSCIIVAKSVLYLLLIVLDYVLYYIIDKARVFMIGTMQTYSSRTEISVEGSGFIAELSRRVVRALTYINSDFFQTHLLPCVPNPKHPNKFINMQIYVWLSLFWFAWLTKPYMLRGRHLLMDWYFPEKAEKRAIWLYKKISLRRVTLLSLVRMKMKSKLGSGASRTVSVVDLVRARWPWLTRILGKGSMTLQCSVCDNLSPPLYCCPTGDCPAVYCDDCYVSVHGVCCLCTQPMMVSDFKNINLETTEASLTLQAETEDGFCEIDGLECLKCDFSYQGGKARAWDPDTLHNRLKSFEKRTVVENDELIDIS